MTTPEVFNALLVAGYDRRQLTPDLARLAETQLQEARLDPLPLVARALKAKRDCELAAGAAAKLKEILDGLLAGPAILCKCEGVAHTPQGAQATVAWQGRELREMPIHPDVDVAQIVALEPWHWVKVHAKEQVVIGVCADASAFARAHGEVVEFKDWQDSAAGLARVTQAGGQEQVVRLSPGLRGAALAPLDQLVLCRDATAFAIARAARQTARSRFETPIDRVRVALEQVAGVDAILAKLFEAIELRLLRRDDEPGLTLEPLHGVLLWSLQAGTGKTLIMRALATWLEGMAQARGFELVLYLVKPNELKSMFHGEDARIVRVDLFGAIRARQLEPRQRTLIQLVVLDEIDSLGRRAGGNDGGPVWSSAHNDAIQAFLAEMDGMTNHVCSPAAHVLCVGMTNRPDAVDLALKRPGRFGDLEIEMPRLTAEGAEAIMAAYAPADMPCWLDGAVRTDVAPAELRARLLRPSLQSLFDTIALRYATDSERVEVAAGAILTAVRCREAMSLAKTAAKRRGVFGEGIAAVSADDVRSGLVAQVHAAARELDADRLTLVRCLNVRGRVLSVDIVAEPDLAWNRDLRLVV